MFDDHRIGVRSPAQGGRAEGFGVNPRIANVQLAQAVVQRLGKTPGTTDDKIRLIVVLDCQQILEQRDVDPSTEVEVLSLYRLGFRLTEQAHHPHRVTGILEQAIQLPAKRLVGQRARTLDEPCRPDTAGAQPLVNHFPQHRQQRRDADPGRQQHQWPTLMGRHGEMPLRRPRLQQVANTNLLMQMRRHPPVTLHADAEKIIGWRAR
ncbi:hypothetical protein D3C86_1119490 [compost metagenome]